MKRFLGVLLTVCFLLMGITPTKASTTETPSGIAFNELEKEIDTFMGQYIDVSSPGAGIAVVKDGKIIFSKGYGYADIENKKTIDPMTTVFEYGSVSKLFVWTAVMQLVEQGKIDLNEDIKTYLPKEFASKLKYEKPITMLNLMSHTAGFEEYPFDLIQTSKENVKTLEEILIEGQPKQVYEPGSTIAYSNYATSLAGYIVEHLSGKPFSQYEMEHIFNAVRMENTSGHPTLADKPELENQKALGYIKANEQFVNGVWSYVPHYPAGAVNGTLEDLARYAIALTPKDNEPSSLFANRKTLDEMFLQSYTPHENLASNAHGFWEYDGKVRGVGHGGNTVAFSANMVVVPEERLGVVVLTNAAGEMDINYGIMKLVLGNPDQQVAVTSQQLPNAKEMEGTYIASRTSKSSFLEWLLGISSVLKVESVNENEIKISAYGMEGTYVQTSPYFYELTSSTSMLDPKVFFEVDGDKVKRVTSGQVADYLPLEWDRQLPWYYISLAIIVLSLLYFGITLVVMLISWLRNRNKVNIKSGQKWHVWMTVLGAVFVLNNVLLLVRSIVALSTMSLPFADIKWHILLNWALLVVAAVCIVGSLLQWRVGQLTKGQKFVRYSSLIMLLLLIVVLLNWNFFNIIA